MNARFLLLLSFFVFSCQTTPPQQDEVPPPLSEQPEQAAPMPRMGILKTPKYPADSIILDHGFMRILFDKKRKLPLMVIYKQNSENLKKRYIDRKDDDFESDRCLLKNYPDLALKEKDFINRTKYNIGHMAPAEDFTWDKDSFMTVMYLSNMVPQAAKLNQRAWRLLEEQVLNWGCGEKDITVITGPIFARKTKLMNGVLEVPNRFYKIVVDESGKRKMVSFIYNEDDVTAKPEEKIVSLKEIEKATGLSIQNEIQNFSIFSAETKYGIADWTSDTKSCPQKAEQIADSVVRKEWKNFETVAKKTQKNKNAAVQVSKVPPPCWETLK